MSAAPSRSVMCAFGIFCIDDQSPFGVNGLSSGLDRPMLSVHHILDTVLSLFNARNIARKPYYYLLTVVRVCMTKLLSSRDSTRQQRWSPNI